MINKSSQNFCKFVLFIFHLKHAINPVNRWLMRSHVSNVSSQTEERQIDIVRTYAKNKLGFINYTRKWNELQCVVS